MSDSIAELARVDICSYVEDMGFDLDDVHRRNLEIKIAYWMQQAHIQAVNYMNDDIQMQIADLQKFHPIAFPSLFWSPPGW